MESDRAAGVACGAASGPIRFSALDWAKVFALLRREATFILTQWKTNDIILLTKTSKYAQFYQKNKMPDNNMHG